MVAGGETRFCGGLEATPWGNEIIEEFAERAISNEQLGQHSGVDVLAVSFSANDYVGHAVGPDDPAVRDISIRTDRLLGKLLDYVDARVGKDNTLVVLTADHGVAPVPEINGARNMPGGRLSEARFLERVSGALIKRFGPGKWLLSSSPTMLYLNLELIQTRKLDLKDVERVAAQAASQEAHIARVYTRDELLSGQVQRDEISGARSAWAFMDRLERRYFKWPAAEDNSVLRLARERLLGGTDRRTLPGAAAQQGLIQMVRDFCDHSTSICNKCKLPELVREFGACFRKI